MNKKITIAIDGYSSTGKSTLAKELARYLGYIYVDTGAMYRAVAYFAMQNDFINNGDFDKISLIERLPNLKLDFKYNNTLGFSEIHLDGVNIENEIRTIAVSNYVSRIAEISEVRTKLVEQQQEMGKNKGIVMDGRDIGTVVFPGAEIKIFMTASAEIRAKRRFEELIGKGATVTFEAVLKNVEERDYIDTHRKDSPLIQANDAIVFDNSFVSKEDQFKFMVNHINKYLQSFN